MSSNVTSSWPRVRCIFWGSYFLLVYPCGQAVPVAEFLPIFLVCSLFTNFRKHDLKTAYVSLVLIIFWNMGNGLHFLKILYSKVICLKGQPFNISGLCFNYNPVEGLIFWGSFFLRSKDTHFWESILMGRLFSNFLLTSSFPKIVSSHFRAGN